MLRKFGEGELVGLELGLAGGFFGGELGVSRGGLLGGVGEEGFELGVGEGGDSGSVLLWNKAKKEVVLNGEWRVAYVHGC